MYPFWDTVIAPLVRASEAQRIVEIGALRGETTVKMLDDLGPTSELHVIDPLPQFDPGEHERKFPGRYVFHRNLSLEVLPDAPPFDVALIDGDHNWYTVYNELREIAAGARRADRNLPLLILHDVGWPYGRRDLYYNPSDVPEEFRQPHAQRGMTPGREKLLPAGGMNITLDNALVEGGERNGVRTGLDDFMAEHDRPLRQVIIPIYFGLAIVAEEAYLAEHPKVAALLDTIESHQGTKDLLELSEQIRLEGVVFDHNIDRMRNERFDRAARRYLQLLQGSLLDEHYLENEERIDYLLHCALRGTEVDPAQLRDPAVKRPRNMRDRALARESGLGDTAPGHFAYAAMGRERLEQLDDALRSAVDAGTDGDFVDVHTGRGGAAIYMRGFLDALEIPDREVWVVDEFRSAPAGGARSLAEAGTADLLSDLNQVRDGFDRFHLLDDRVRFLQGTPADTLPDAPIESIAVLRIGPGPAATITAALESLYDRVRPGGIVVVEDGSAPNAAAAVEAFRSEHGVSAVEQVAWTGTAWRKTEATDTAPKISAVRNRAPLAPRVRGDLLDLSVVTVFYNMRREAERTLHSLSRAYQRDIDDLRYEVVVIDNGSSPEQRLTEEFVESFGPEFRLISMGDEARPSPTHALNEGIAASTGENLALMIDGAHVLTPGVLRHAMAGLRSYAPGIVATQQWYVGPGQQPDAVTLGYDEQVEDELFEGIEWPTDGYRLFEIGHFIGDRDWFDGMLESNCLFAPRSLLEQVGGFDDSFSMPGGGYANLELYERLGSHPGVSMTTIIGEGSFHQVHGGTTTNDGTRHERREKTFSYGEHYGEKFGRRLSGPANHLHYVGSFTSTDSRRTRARRLLAMGFGNRRTATGVDGVPDEPTQIPDELKMSFLEAFWHTLSWQDSTWLGDPITNAPTDLMIYQELITRLRPDHIVITTRKGAGTAAFLASICELIDHGTVIAVGNSAGSLADHPRLEIVRGATTAPESVEAVRALVGDGPSGLVVFGGSGRKPDLMQEFELYAPFVSVDSYAIVENTIVNGRPVWPGFGPGPTEAIRDITARRGDFMQDTGVERFGLTFNPGGYLRRVK